MFRSLCLLLVIMIVSGCGQKGPLYRPGEITDTPVTSILMPHQIYV